MFGTGSEGAGGERARAFDALISDSSGDHCRLCHHRLSGARWYPQHFRLPSLLGADQRPQALTDLRLLCARLCWGTERRLCPFILPAVSPLTKEETEAQLMTLLVQTLSPLWDGSPRKLATCPLTQRVRFLTTEVPFHAHDAHTPQVISLDP